MRFARRPCRSLLYAALYSVLAYACVFSAQLLAKEPSQERPLLGSFSTSDRYSEENNLSISISVERDGAGYRLGFQGYGRALHGHAPEGSGHGEINGGVFRFQFQDSFSNRGTGTFRRVGRRYLLHIDISEIAEARIMAAYGDDIPLYRDRPNQAMQRTAGRSAFPLSMTSTFNPQRRALSPAVADLMSR